jgi:hypothetical protein
MAAGADRRFVQTGPRRGDARILRFAEASSKTIDDFERLAMTRLEAGSGLDRGADGLIRQTRFFVAAFAASRAMRRSR